MIRKGEGSTDSEVFGELTYNGFIEDQNGEIITNDPNIKKTPADDGKDSLKDTSNIKSDEVWFDDVDPVLLDVTEKGLVGEKDAEEALVKAKSFTGLTKVGYQLIYRGGDAYAGAWHGL